MGIGRTEFWICVALVIVGTASLFLYINLLRSSTRADLARRQWLVQRAIADREARRMA